MLAETEGIKERVRLPENNRTGGGGGGGQDRPQGKEGLNPQCLGSKEAQHTLNFSVDLNLVF